VRNSAGRRGGDRTGLSAHVPNTLAKGVSGRITGRWRANAHVLESGKSLTSSRGVIESWRRPMMVVGRNPFGKCRIIALYSETRGWGQLRRFVTPFGGSQS